MVQSTLSGIRFVSPSRWESPHLRQTQKESLFCLSVLGLCCNLAPCLSHEESTSPSDWKLPLSVRETDSFSPFSFRLENSPTEYLKPYHLETSVGIDSPGREGNVVYHSSHSPIRRTSVLPYFHSVSPSLSEDTAVWLKYRTLSGYPITNEDIERCRGWIVQRVIRPFIIRILPFKDYIPLLSPFSELDLSFLNHVEQRHRLPPVRDAEEEFFFLRRYLSMDSYPSACEYIFERLLQLSKDNYMSLFSYSDWKLDESSLSHSMNIPSDAEIVVHVVSCFIDEVIQRCSGVSHFVSKGSFTSRHVDVSFPSPLIRSHGNESLLYKLGGWKYRSGAVICFLQRRPPLFAVVGQEGKCLSIPMGRTNVFAAIIGLFKLIYEYFDGQLFQVSFDSPYLGSWIKLDKGIGRFYTSQQSLAKFLKKRMGTLPMKSLPTC
ncbi:hypothetical protein Gasu2_66370 [Galdieria sulphuraria]|nr:hypothetical protein Gasu2_66370 [Galdieria sulphuraria]